MDRTTKRNGNNNKKKGQSADATSMPSSVWSIRNVSSVSSSVERANYKRERNKKVMNEVIDPYCAINRNTVAYILLKYFFFFLEA